MDSANPEARKIVIGDVHGQYDGLMYLLALVAPQAEDEVCFMGDLIDRGPKSAHVVDFVMHSPYQCLMGNHEKMLVDAIHGGQVIQPTLHAWLYSGGQNTLVSYQDLYGEMGIPEAHFDWFRSLPYYLDWGDYWLVHAGVDPGRTIAEQGPREFCWIREGFQGCDRPYFKDKTIITGHTITFTLPGINPGELARGPGWIDIDTGAYHPRSGWLTAVDLTNQLAYQVNVYRPETRTLPLAQAAKVVNPIEVAGSISHFIGPEAPTARANAVSGLTEEEETEADDETEVAEPVDRSSDSDEADFSADQNLGDRDHPSDLDEQGSDVSSDVLIDQALTDVEAIDPIAVEPSDLTALADQSADQAEVVATVSAAAVEHPSSVQA